MAGLFYARSADLYLKDGGVIGMVMPHSALQAGQYTKWRTGAWKAGNGLRTLSVDFGLKTAWDLEKLEPNTFFPVPASVVFAKRTGSGGKANPLAGGVERWLGSAGAGSVRRELASISDTSIEGDFPYAGLSRQGAVIVPRCLFFVEETENPAIVQAGQTVTVNPRRGSQDKVPWKSLDLTDISEQTVEALKGDWNQVEPLGKSIKSAIEQTQPNLDSPGVKHEIEGILNEAPASGEFPNELRKGIEATFSKASRWERIKNAGQAALPPGDTTQRFQQIQQLCKQAGLWIVAEGQLEGFCRSVGDHGPRWAQKVIEQKT